MGDWEWMGACCVGTQGDRSLELVLESCGGLLGGVFLF